MKLFMEKATEPSATVTVSSLTSTPVEDQNVEGTCVTYALHVRVHVQIHVVHAITHVGVIMYS